MGRALVPLPALPATCLPTAGLPPRKNFLEKRGSSVKEQTLETTEVWPKPAVSVTGKLQHGEVKVR